MQITEQQHRAADEIIELIASKLGDNRAIHPGTAISSCARLAGSFLFRSFKFSMKDISPGTAVLSTEANEKGLVLINILGLTLSSLEVNIDSNKLNELPKGETKLDFLDALNLLQGKAVGIMNGQGLNFELMAYSCTMATAFLIKECQRDLAVESGFNTAIYGFIEGCKTCPPELSNSVKKKNGFFSFWK